MHLVVKTCISWVKVTKNDPSKRSKQRRVSRCVHALSFLQTTTAGWNWVHDRRIKTVRRRTHVPQIYESDNDPRFALLLLLEPSISCWTLILNLFKPLQSLCITPKSRCSSRAKRSVALSCYNHALQRYSSKSALRCSYQQISGSTILIGQSWGRHHKNFVIESPLNIQKGAFKSIGFPAMSFKYKNLRDSNTFNVQCCEIETL